MCSSDLHGPARPAEVLPGADCPAHGEGQHGGLEGGIHEEGHRGHVHAAVLLLGADQHEGIGVGEGRRLVDGDVFHTVIVLSESSTMLTTSLRELERDGLVSRVQFNEIPPRVEYSLTEKGRALLPVFYEMTRWGFRYIPCGRLCKNAALSCGIFVIHLFFNTFWSE